MKVRPFYLSLKQVKEECSDQSVYISWLVAHYSPTKTHEHSRTHGTHYMNHVVTDVRAGSAMNGVMTKIE